MDYGVGVKFSIIYMLYPLRVLRPKFQEKTSEMRLEIVRKL